MGICKLADNHGRQTLSNRGTQLAERNSRAARLPNAEIARRTGLDENTVGRVLSGKGVQFGSFDKVEACIAAEEDDLRQKLGAAPAGQAAE